MSNPDLMSVAQQLADLCRRGENLQAIDTLYAEDVVSVEAMDSPGDMPRTMNGKAAVRGKNQWWFENHELHGGDVRGPLPHLPDRFALIFAFDVTPKAGPMAGQRMQLEEVAIYTVENGKIAHEAFFYTME